MGAGFAVFETAGYAMRMSSMEQAIQILFVRGGLSVGGHVVWTAIAGAALMAMRRPEMCIRDRLCDMRPGEKPTLPTYVAMRGDKDKYLSLLTHTLAKGR